VKLVRLFIDQLTAIVAQFRDPSVALFSILAVSFTLLASFLNYRNLKKRFTSDYPALLTYFGFFFLLLFAVPLAYLLLVGRAAGLTPAMLGLKLGNWRVGLVSCLVAVPLILITLSNSARDPVIRAWYPFSKDATTSIRRFVVYEAAYILLYYLAWDFAFRGLIQFSLVRLLPAGLPGTIVAIMAQTLLSTVYHLGHPDSEIWGAFAVGIIFGVITAVTGSILYSFVIHALIGAGNDVYIYAAGRRPARGKGNRRGHE
jgi:hypothetical protein